MEELPGLAQYGHIKTSDKTPAYNCIAWADYDQTNWWWPFGPSPENFRKNAFWPGTMDADTIASFVEAFEIRGFARCNAIDTSFQDGVEKIAIYARGMKATHAARQLADGRWTHKLGQDIDVTASLKAVEGAQYGNVAVIMQRQR